MIGFVDSGIGGVFVLKQCLKICPNNHFVYLSDNKNIPYGNKSKKKLIKIAIKNCEFLILKGCTIIVFACNTLTAVAIETCRKKFPFIKFVGIEPAVKPALSNCKNILVLCTRATFFHSQFLKSFKHNKKIVFLPQKKLAKDIENGKEIDLKKYVKKTNFDGIVLGCTHYNFIANKIKDYFKTQNIFEASEGVAKRLKTLRDISQKSKAKTKLEFVFTGKKKNTKRCFFVLNNDF